MKIKILMLVVIGTVVILGTLKISSTSKQQRLEELHEAKERGTVDWYIQQAKTTGKKEISIPPPIVEYVTEISDLNEAASYYHFLIVEPIEEKTYALEHKIVTWYKLKIDSNLTEKDLNKCSTCSLPDDVPQEMLPLNQGEILIVKNGGSILRDNVTIKMIDPAFPAFKLKSKYLLILELDPSRSVGRIMVGPGAVFTVEPNGQIAPISNNSHRLKLLLEKNYGNSLPVLKAALRERVVSQ